MDTIVYLHICSHCGRGWKDETKANACPKCGYWHIWFRGTSEIKDKEVTVNAKVKEQEN